MKVEHGLNQGLNNAAQPPDNIAIFSALMLGEL